MSSFERLILTADLSTPLPPPLDEAVFERAKWLYEKGTILYGIDFRCHYWYSECIVLSGSIDGVETMYFRVIHDDTKAHFTIGGKKLRSNDDEGYRISSSTMEYAVPEAYWKVEEFAMMRCLLS